ncbi:MAG TPA: glycosyltransferase family 39 protein [Ktedonobacterales bacterium]|nr:glycosyltransferase family 39 protein [Ktedonobacterales bacterium]
MNEESFIITQQAAPNASEKVPWWAWIQQQARGDAVKTAFGAWLALRCYCTFIGIALYFTVPASVFTSDLKIAFGGTGSGCPQYAATGTGLSGALAGIWLRWDTPWYLEIAAHGYSCYGSSAFMPLYPLLIRGLGFLAGGNDLAAALLISSIASFFAFYLLYQLAQELTGSSDIARISVIALAVFPVSFFLMAGYTEALFLVLAMGAYLAARRNRWLLAGALAALTTLTRLQGILLLVPLGLELLLTQRGQLWRWRPWLALLLAPLALGLFIIFIRLTEGLSLPWEPLTSARGAWHLHYVWPWQGVIADLGALIAQPDLGTLLSFKLFDPLSALLFALGAVLAFRRLNLPLAVFLVVMWLSSVIKVNDAGYTTSISRYMLALFPAFIVLGMVVSRWPRRARLGVGIGSGILLSVYLFLFLIWFWVA